MRDLVLVCGARVSLLQCARCSFTLVARGYASCSVRGVVLFVALTRRIIGAALGHLATEVDGLSRMIGM